MRLNTTPPPETTAKSPQTESSPGTTAHSPLPPSSLPSHSRLPYSTLPPRRCPSPRRSPSPPPTSPIYPSGSLLDLPTAIANWTPNRCQPGVFSGAGNTAPPAHGAGVGHELGFRRGSFKSQLYTARELLIVLDKLERTNQSQPHENYRTAPCGRRTLLGIVRHAFLYRHFESAGSASVIRLPVAESRKV